MIILKDHSISKKAEARSIIIKKGSEKKVSNFQGKDVIVYIKDFPAFNSQISYSKPSFYVSIPSKYIKKLEKYFGKPLDITLKLSEKIKK